VTAHPPNPHPTPDREQVCPSTILCPRHCLSSRSTLGAASERIAAAVVVHRLPTAHTASTSIYNPASSPSVTSELATSHIQLHSSPSQHPANHRPTHTSHTSHPPISKPWLHPPSHHLLLHLHPVLVQTPPPWTIISCLVPDRFHRWKRVAML
jgi:hypothetical protein